MTNIVVVAEVRGGQLKRPSLEVVTPALQLATAAGGKVIAIVCGAGLDAACAELAKSGVHQVVAIEGGAFANYSGDAQSKAIAEQVKAAGAKVVLMAHTAMGKDLLPRVAALLEAAIVTDVVGLSFAGGAFQAQRPVFSGKATMTVKAKSPVACFTVRPNSFPAAAGGGAAAVGKVAAPAGDLLAVVKEVIAAGGGKTPLAEAKVVVAGGRGLKEAQHFKLIEDLAAAFGPGVAAVGATRAVVDAGWRSHSEQVGQTGKVVSPPLYFAIGISGAIQHIAGMRTARTIVAINKDPDAPIFKIADYGIVGDAFEVLPALTKAIAEVCAHK